MENYEDRDYIFWDYLRNAYGRDDFPILVLALKVQNL